MFLIVLPLAAPLARAQEGEAPPPKEAPEPAAPKQGVEAERERLAAFERELTELRALVSQRAG